MKNLTLLATKLVILTSMLTLSFTSAQAGSVYWNNTAGGAAATATNWSSTANGSGAAGAPTVTDTAVFTANNVTNSPLTITINSTQSIQDLLFNGKNAGTTLLESNSVTPSTLSLGNGGSSFGSSTIISVDAGAGAVTIGNASQALNLTTQAAPAGSQFTISNVSSNPLTIQNGVTVNLSGTGVGTYNITGAGGTIFNGTLADQSTTKKLALSVSGGSSATLNNTNTFTGNTSITGTLQVNSNGALGGTTSVAINSGGSLIFGGSGVTSGLNNTATVTMTGGSSLVLNGASQTIGTLTLNSGVNTINLDHGGLLTLNNIGSWASGAKLDIVDWVGPNFTTGDATHQIDLGSGALSFFASNPGLLDDISWTDSTIGGQYYGSINYGQIVGAQLTPGLSPVPEPSTIFSGLCLLGLITWSARRKILKAGLQLIPVRA